MWYNRALYNWVGLWRGYVCILTLIKKMWCCRDLYNWVWLGGTPVLGMSAFLPIENWCAVVGLCTTGFNYWRVHLHCISSPYELLHTEQFLFIALCCCHYNCFMFLLFFISHCTSTITDEQQQHYSITTTTTTQTSIYINC